MGKRIEETLRCQCPETGYVTANRLIMYDVVKERPYVNHKPGECKCTNDIRLYNRNGELLYLCSCCYMSNDKLVTQ